MSTAEGTAKMLDEICERWFRLPDEDQRALLTYARMADKGAVSRPAVDYSDAKGKTPKR